MKEKDFDEETNLLNSQKVGDLLEPLVNEEKPQISSKNKLIESVNIISNNDNDNDINTDKNKLRFKTIDFNKYKEKEKNDKIKKIRNELNDFDKETEDTSNYSNEPSVEILKCQNFIFIIILTIFSSLQFGIYVLIFNLYLNKANINININSNNSNNFSSNKLYLLFLVLSWKYQIYFIFYLIYAIAIFFKNRKNNNEATEDSIPLIKNNSTNLFDFNPTYNFRKFKYRYLIKYGSSYSSYFNIFIFTSDIFNYQGNKNFFENFLNIEEIIKGICGLIFSYALFTGSFFFYFGIIYLIQSITALIPYYIKFNFNLKKNNNKNIASKIDTRYIKFIFPILLSIGFYSLLKSLPININLYNYLYLLLILFVCILCQIYLQKQFVLNSHDESPFHILFRTYFIYFLISNIFTLTFELIFNQIKNIFFWLTDIYLFLACFISFGILGAICYNMLLTFMRIALSNNVIVKLIKYFNFIIIDLVGIFVFKQYDIFNKIDYFMGISLCVISLFMLDFCELL